MQKLRRAIKKYLKTVDKWLLVFCVFLSTLSVLLLYSLYQSDLAQTLRLTERTCIVQLAAMFLGLGAAVIISNIDYHFIVKLWKLYIPISVFLVVLTFFVGLQVDESVDDKAWLRLPFGLTFQPSELLKICFIMSFAYHLSKVRSEINKPLNVLLLCAHGAFPILLIHFQGDDGTAIVFAFIFIVMLFAAGIDWKYMLAGIALLAVAVPIAWQYLLTDNQRGRFLALYFSEYNATAVDDYQQSRGLISIGLGQLLGKGLFQKDYFYVPMMHNDFIFSFIGQALGFVGTMVVVAALCGICLRAIVNARTAYDPLGAYICYGFFAMFFSQCLINIGMCVSALPVIGITLPFLSAGGTSVCITYLGVGLLLSVQVHRQRNLFFE